MGKIVTWTKKSNEKVIRSKGPGRPKKAVAQTAVTYNELLLEFARASGAVKRAALKRDEVWARVEAATKAMRYGKKTPGKLAS